MRSRRPRLEARRRSPRPARQSRDSPKIRDDGRTTAQPKARPAGADPGPESGQLDGDRRRRFAARQATRMSSSPPSNPARRRRASTDSPRWGALAPTAATSTGCGAPKRPSSSRVHRKREFGDGGAGPSGRRPAASLRRRSFAAVGGRETARRSRRPEPEPTARATSRLPAPAMRTQRKLTLIGRRSTTSASARDAAARRWEASPPDGAGAARDGPSPRSSRASSASQSLAPNKASMAGLALTIRARRGQDRQPRLVVQPVSAAPAADRRPRRLRRATSAAGSAADDGGEWVKVGAREWTSNRRRSASPTIRALSLAKA